MDRPILFSGSMVRALLEGRKTQTRRVFKGIEQFDSGDWHIFNGGGGVVNVREEDVPARAVDYAPYATGDRLYVREAWRAQEAFDDLSPVGIGHCFEDEYGEAWCPTFYEADNRCDGSSIDMWQQSPPGLLRQGMHMPRLASRLTLLVTEVRVQRLREISEADAIAEGVEPAPPGRTAVVQYLGLWDSLNADRGFGWGANPWVVAVSFAVHRGNIDALAGGA